MSWASVAEVKALCLQIAGVASGSLPSGWDTRATEAVAETKAQIQQALGLRGFSGSDLDNAVNLKGIHLDLAAYRLLSAEVSLDEDARANVDRLDRSVELAALIPLDSNGAPVGGAAAINADVPVSTTSARDRIFGAPEDISW